VPDQAKSGPVRYFPNFLSLDFPGPDRTGLTDHGRICVSAAQRRYVCSSCAAALRACSGRAATVCVFTPRGGGAFMLRRAATACVFKPRSGGACAFRLFSGGVRLCSNHAAAVCVPWTHSDGVLFLRPRNGTVLVQAAQRRCACFQVVQCRCFCSCRTTIVCMF